MNHDQKTTEYLENLAKLKLSDSARVRMQTNLVSYVRFHGVNTKGVRVGDDSRSIKQVPSRTSFFNYIRNIQPKSMTAAILVIMLFIGGGTSYAAESAVPGDFLYTVKTAVNENVQNALAFSNESQAELQVRLAAERLEEAETLAARGELSTEASADISARLKSHYDAAEVHSVAAEAAGNYELSATVRASMEGNLRTHATILTDLNTRISGNNGTGLIATIGTYVGMSADAQTAATATIEASIDAKAHAAATIKAADRVILEEQSKLARAEATVSADVSASAKASLAKAVAAKVSAQAAFETGVYTAAYENSRMAIRMASEVDTMINSRLHLPVNIGVTTDMGDEGVLNTDSRTTSSAAGTTSEATATTTTNGTSSNNSLDIKIDAQTDATLENDIIDATIKTDINVKSGLNL